MSFGEKGEEWTFLSIVCYQKNALTHHTIISVHSQDNYFCSKKGVHFLHTSEFEIAQMYVILYETKKYGYLTGDLLLSNTAL
jgi:hypothetical protein